MTLTVRRHFLRRTVLPLVTRPPGHRISSLLPSPGAIHQPPGAREMDRNPVESRSIHVYAPSVPPRPTPAPPPPHPRPPTPPPGASPSAGSVAPAAVRSAAWGRRRSPRRRRSPAPSPSALGSPPSPAPPPAKRKRRFQSWNFREKTPWPLAALECPVLSYRYPYNGCSK